MPDPFIDDLRNRLQAEDAHGTAGEHGPPSSFAVLKQRWWEEFIDVLGQKVGAWNERAGSSRTPVNFTRKPDESALIWHAHAEASLRLRENHVVVDARLRAARVEGKLMELHDAGNGVVLASLDGETFASPTEAAEQVITPILAAVFRSVS